MGLALLAGYLLGAHRGKGALRQRLLALAARLGADDPATEPHHIEDTMVHVERATDRAAEAVAESSSEAIRLRRALDVLPQAVIVSDEHSELVFRNSRVIALDIQPPRRRARCPGGRRADDDDGAGQLRGAHP